MRAIDTLGVVADSDASVSTAAAPQDRGIELPWVLRRVGSRLEHLAA